MLVIKKENNDNLVRHKKQRAHNQAYNIILYILKNFSDLSIDDQYLVFSKMTIRGETKEDFIRIRTIVLAEYGSKLNEDSVTITDIKAGYHLANGMLEMHFDSIEQINDQLEYYEEEFIKEKDKEHPDIDKLAKMSLVTERLINRRSVLNVGTPIILFFRYQIKKQKLEMQQLKEKYAQKNLEKLVLPTEEKKDPQKLDIPEKPNVTNNIDELEHRAKLKDPKTRISRGNTNRQDPDATDEQLRVQSASDVNDKTSTGGQDTSTEDNRSGNERRTKEAVF